MMKTTYYARTPSILLVLLGLILQPAYVMATASIPHISVLLLSHATNLDQVNIPDNFSWETTRDLTINIQLLSASGAPFNGQMIVEIFGDPDGDASFSQNVVKMMTDATGQLSVTISIPSAWTQLKVIAQDSSTDPPNAIIQLDSSTSVDLPLTLRDSDPGDAEGSQ